MIFLGYLSHIWQFETIDFTLTLTNNMMQEEFLRTRLHENFVVSKLCESMWSYS